MTAASIDVAFTPADVRATQVTVVVDVLRASSTIVAALAAGYARVLCAGDVEQARRLRGPGRELAGERECRKIEGFDHGNSPREFEGTRTGDLVLCTTNGTPAILAAVAASDYVLVGSLSNLDALVAAVAAVPAGANTTVVCAGTNGRFALEDAYTAGRIVGGLEGELSDAAKASMRLASAYDEPLMALADSADAAALRATGQEDDIALCARASVHATVPRVTTASAGVAVVSGQAQGVASGEQEVDLINKSIPMDWA
jgi:2-phosphosulfolactate phosphatase